MLAPMLAPVSAVAPRIDVLTGFLGVGKTTLLNRLLREPAFADTAVIVNEFGTVAIDHLLVEAVEGEMMVLTTGCLCCAARGDLLAAVEGLLSRRAALGFGRILIETTGLADPGPVLNALLLGPCLAGTAAPGGVLTLVSALDGSTALDRHDEARRQVALADRLLITKADLAPEAVPALGDRLAALNPAVPIGEARGAALAPSLFASSAAWRPAGHGHHHHHAADARIRSVALSAGIVDAGALGAFVAELQRRHGPGLLRLKGIAALCHDPARPVVVQAVGHLLHPVSPLDRRPPGESGTRLVAILEGADPAEVAALWESFFGPPAIDRPDAAALRGEAGAGPSGLFG